MKINEFPSSAFTAQALIAATVPAYAFPTVMSFLPGYFLQKADLMAASYSTIGLSSLLSTILSFILLWQCERRQILVHNKLVRSIVVVITMMGLGVLCAFLFHLESECFNIVLSAFIGATILSVRQKVILYQDEKN